MKTKYGILIVAILLLGLAAIHAQSDTPLGAPIDLTKLVASSNTPAGHAPTMLLTHVADCFQDVGVNVTVGGLTKLVGVIFLLGRLFLRYAPDNLKQGKLAVIAEHCALNLKAVAPQAEAAPLDIKALVEEAVKKALTPPAPQSLPVAK